MYGRGAASGGVTGGVNSVEEWWVRTELGWQQFQSPTRNRLEDSLVKSEIKSEVEMLLLQISYTIKTQLKAPKALYKGHILPFTGSLWHFHALRGSIIGASLRNVMIPTIITTMISTVVTKMTMEWIVMTTTKKVMSQKKNTQMMMT